MLTLGIALVVCLRLVQKEKVRMHCDLQVQKSLMKCIHILKLKIKKQQDFNF